MTWTNNVTAKAGLSVRPFRNANDRDWAFEYRLYIIVWTSDVESMGP